MGIYRGTAPLKAYKGDMQPVNVYRGSTKVAGWHSANYSGTSPLTVDCDYNVPPDALAIDGKCVQTGTPSPDSPAPISTITGDVTITGADGAASDTATVAFGSAVCASLPDGTHDSYDAVTGVLTKNVGKVVEASGTSWTISDAASDSSILSDCFGADMLSGTGFSAYDAVCQPNLTPFFSHSLADSSYWKYIDTRIAQLTDGWARVSIDTTGNSGVQYSSIFVLPPNAVPIGDYTLLIEIKNAVSTGNGTDEIQLYMDTVDSTSNQMAPTSYMWIKLTKDADYYCKLVPRTDHSDIYACFQLKEFNPAGCTASFDMRLSLYEGTYTGAYKPYALPCAPTVYYKLATPTTVQLTPHLPVVRTGIKTLSVGADVVPTVSATVKSMD